MKKLAYGIWLLLLVTGNAQAPTADAIRITEAVRTSSSWDGSPLPVYPKGTPEITILRISIPPGAQLPLHRHPVINAAVLLAGELTIVAEGNRTLHLKAGESVVEVVNKWHYGKNEGRRSAELIVFYAGAVDTPITIEAGKTDDND